MRYRDYALDNARFILVVLVVFGHLLEISTGYSNNCDLYRVIYSFHMPVLLFISGYFAKFNKKKIIKTLLLYVLFQLTYILFSNVFFDTNLEYQLLFPYWLLWYLLVYLFYLCLIPILDSKKNKYEQMITVIIISFTMYFVSPYIYDDGTVLSISRFFTFLPFFALGFYLKTLTNYNINKLFKSKKVENVLRLSFLLLAIIATVIILFSDTITFKVLYGSFAYKDLYSPITRLILLYCSISWIGFFLITLRINKKISIITKCGGNTISIFLLHGFVIKLIDYSGLVKNHKINVLLLFASSILLSILLGLVKIRNSKDTKQNDCKE